MPYRAPSMAVDSCHRGIIRFLATLSMLVCEINLMSCCCMLVRVSGSDKQQTNCHLS